MLPPILFLMTTPSGMVRLGNTFVSLHDVYARQQRFVARVRGDLVRREMQMLMELVEEDADKLRRPG